MSSRRGVKSLFISLAKDQIENFSFWCFKICFFNNKNIYDMQRVQLWDSQSEFEHIKNIFVGFLHPSDLRLMWSTSGKGGADKKFLSNFYIKNIFEVVWRGYWKYSRDEIFLKFFFEILKQKFKIKYF